MRLWFVHTVFSTVSVVARSYINSMLLHGQGGCGGTVPSRQGSGVQTCYRTNRRFPCARIYWSPVSTMLSSLVTATPLSPHSADDTVTSISRILFWFGTKCHIMQCKCHVKNYEMTVSERYSQIDIFSILTFSVDVGIPTSKGPVIQLGLHTMCAKQWKGQILLIACRNIFRISETECWRHDIGTLSTLLVICEGKPPVDTKGRWCGV